MTKPIDWSNVTSIESMAGEDEDETQTLRALHERARTYLAGFDWHKGVAKSWFGLGLADIVGVFLLEVAPCSASVDRFLWVVVGDIPPAYLVTDDAPDPVSALKAYIGEMRRWADAVKSGRSIGELIPVNAPPTATNAADLTTRLKFLEEEVLPRYRGSGR